MQIRERKDPIVHIDISTLQSIGVDQGFSTLVKSLLFYVVINLEAFIFCFAGEYLSVKVSSCGC